MRVTVVVVFVVSVVACGMTHVLAAHSAESTVRKSRSEITSFEFHLGSENLRLRLSEVREELDLAEHTLRHVIVIIGLFGFPLMAIEGTWLLAAWGGGGWQNRPRIVRTAVKASMVGALCLPVAALAVNFLAEKTFAAVFESWQERGPAWLLGGAVIGALVGAVGGAIWGVTRRQ